MNDDIVLPQVGNLNGPPVSIGMPVYNGEPFLERAIESILAQTYRNFELIISDNASTDRTEDLCRHYAEQDPRIHYVRQPSNIGAVNNFRFVLHQARYDRFIWAAADDWWDIDRLEKLVASLGPEDAVVFGTIRRYVGDMPYAEYAPASFLKGEWLRFLMREEAYCEKVFYIYGLIWKEYAVTSAANLTDDYWEDSLFCYRLLWSGNLKSIVGATLHSVAHRSSTGTRMASAYRHSIQRAIYRAHPWNYYKKYIEATPEHLRRVVRGCIPIKAVATQLHLYWRAFRRLVLGRPFVYGALPGGDLLVKKAGL